MRQRTEIQALLSAVKAVAIGAQPRADLVNVAYEPNSDLRTVRYGLLADIRKVRSRTASASSAC